MLDYIFIRSVLLFSPYTPVWTLSTELITDSAYGTLSSLAYAELLSCLFVQPFYPHIPLLFNFLPPRQATILMSLVCIFSFVCFPAKCVFFLCEMNAFFFLFSLSTVFLRSIHVAMYISNPLLLTDELFCCDYCSGSGLAKIQSDSMTLVFGD